MDSNDVKSKEELSKELSKKIDELVGELKKSLLSTPYNPRGLFDKVKNWWQNVTKGADSTNNPYYFQNKFGSLGKMNQEQDPAEALKNMGSGAWKPKESQPETQVDDEFSLGTSRNESKLSLKEYAFLSENFKNLDKNVSSLILNEEYASNNLKNLELFRIIDSWAREFKNEVLKMFNLPGVQASISQPRVSNSEPEAVPRQQNTPNQKQQINSVDFKKWLKNESNMETFINLVNRIFDSSVHRRPIPVISNSLENRYNVKGPEKTSLTTAVRNRIIGIIKKEIEHSKDESNSVFSEKVWSWAKSLSGVKVTSDEGQNVNDSQSGQEENSAENPDAARERELTQIDADGFI